jgi:hypothetical protein
MEVLCQFYGDSRETVWADIVVKDHYGRIWAERDLNREDYDSDVDFIEAVAEKMKGYRHNWIEGKE